jgi:hypothetical protein
MAVLLVTNMKKNLAIVALVAVSSVSYGQVWAGTGGLIPDGTNTTSTPGSISSTIVGVPGLTSLGAIAIMGLSHTFAGDLVAEVSGPGGTFMLFGRVGRAAAQSYGSPFGYGSNFNGTYVFQDSGGNNLWAAALAAGAGDIPGGGYDASGINGAGAATGLFPGAQPAGNWTLTLSDWAGLDSGSFQGWEIRGTAVPEPATMAALGIGALALLRRRRKS